MGMAEVAAGGGGVAHMQGAGGPCKKEIVDQVSVPGDGLGPDSGGIGQQIIQCQRWAVFSDPCQISGFPDRVFLFFDSGQQVPARDFQKPGKPSISAISLNRALNRPYPSLANPSTALGPTVTSPLIVGVR